VTGTGSGPNAPGAMSWLDQFTGRSAGGGMSGMGDAELQQHLRGPRQRQAIPDGASSTPAASTGVETADDVAAYLLAGADVVMTTSALLRHGPAHVTVLLDGLAAWMERKGFGSTEEVRGLFSVAASGSEADFGRADYLSAIRRATRTYAPRDSSGPGDLDPPDRCLRPDLQPDANRRRGLRPSGVRRVVVPCSRRRPARRPTGGRARPRR